MKMTKDELVATLRDAADRIEGADLPDELFVQTEIKFYMIETRADLKRFSAAMPTKSRWESFGGAHWLESNGPMKYLACFNPNLMRRP